MLEKFTHVELPPWIIDGGRYIADKKIFLGQHNFCRAILTLAARLLGLA